MPGEDHPSDGKIDFAGYSTAQLRDLRFTIDRAARPGDFQNLQAELGRRTQLPEVNAQGDQSWNVTFTRRSGLLGWLEAKTKRLGVYGSGSAAIEIGQLLLRGWGRTWLGVPCRIERSVPLGSILNLVRENRTISFEVRQRLRRKRYEFNLDSGDTAARLAGALPSARTPKFEREWRELHEFNRHLPPSGTGTWATKILVAANFAVYIAMAIVLRRVMFFGIPQLLHWGANYGPLTISGQWWRLLTSTFLHLGPLHILINMWALWNIGRLTERLLGRWPFVALYVICAVLSSVGSMAWNPGAVSAGASGAIFGIFGVFLAFLLKRNTGVPKAIIRPHLLSTTVFVLFSLVSGALQLGIDDAAHVSGLIAGLCLGWIIAQPTLLEVPRKIAVRRMVAAMAFILIASLAGVREAGGVDVQPPVAQEYLQNHLWYTEGETRDLALWEHLAVEAQLGSVSTDYLGRQFKKAIVPFWQSAYKRLRKENLPPEQREIGRLVMNFVGLRLKWAQAVVAATTNNGAQSAKEAEQLSQQTNLALARIQRVSLLSTAERTPRGLINSDFVKRLHRALSRAPNCVLPPQTIAPPVGPHALPGDFPAMWRRRECAAQRAFEYRDFATLAGLLRTPGTRATFPLGASTYADAANGLYDLLEYGHGSVLDALRITAGWRRADPRSALPGLVDAMIFEEWAWAARGGGYVNSVSSLAWRTFAARIAMAAASFQAAGNSARATPLWYQISMQLEIDQNKPLSQIRGTFEQGVARFPEYMPLYREMLRALMPRWFGSYLKINTFIMAQYDKAPPRIADALYTRLYWILAGLSGDTVNIFDASNVDWPSMKGGFQQMQRLDPKSDYILNVFANFACRADDKTEYRYLRGSLHARYSSAAWTKKFSLEKCDRQMGVEKRIESTAGPLQTVKH